MKKNTLIKSAIAVAIVGATTATTIADTSLYGRFRAGIACTDAGGNTDTACSLKNGSSRFGIKVKQDVTDGLTAFGRYEFGVNLDEGQLAIKEGAKAENAANRLAYLGAKGGFGEVSIGTRWTPMYNYVAGPVDPYQMFGGGGGVFDQTSFRSADTVNYKNKFGAASVHLMVKMDEDADADFSDGIELGVGFKAGSINLGLAVADDDADTQVGLHAGTKFGPLGVGLSFITADEADTDSLTLHGKYSLGGGKSIKMNFGSTDNGNNTPTVIGAEYEQKLSKNYHWFAGISSKDTDVAGADDVLNFGTGMRLEF